MYAVFLYRPRRVLCIESRAADGSLNPARLTSSELGIADVRKSAGVEERMVPRKVVAVEGEGQLVATGGRHAQLGAGL